MNGKQLACVVLLLIVGVIVYAARMVHGNTVATVAEAMAAQDAAHAAERAKDDANTILLYTKEKSRELQRFLTAWKPQIMRVDSRQEVEEAIQATTRGRGIFVVSQKFEDKRTPEGPMIARRVMASMVVEDEYSKVMNWLGDLEQKMPLVRITSCRLSAASSGRQVHMEVAMEMPLVDLNADPTGATKKKS